MLILTCVLEEFGCPIIQANLTWQEHCMTFCLGFTYLGEPRFLVFVASGGMAQLMVKMEDICCNIGQITDLTKSSKSGLIKT